MPTQADCRIVKTELYNVDYSLPHQEITVL